MMKRTRTQKTALFGLGGLLLGGSLILLVRQVLRQETCAMLCSADKDFIEKAAQDGMQEISLGYLAEQRGTQDTVRELGTRILRDHSDANSELGSLALRRGFVPPSHLPRKQQSEVEMLARLSPSAFDKAFLRKMVSEHQKAIRMFQQAAAHGEDLELRAFAQRTLPTLHEHLRQALALS